MPYEIRGTTVVKKDTGVAVPGGSHKTHAEALAHLRALEVNVSDAKAEGVMPTAPVASVRTLNVLANPFGGPYNGTDAQGQFFDAQTDFWHDKQPETAPPFVYYHGKTNPDGTPAGQAEFLGLPVQRWVDKQGVWYRVPITGTGPGAQRINATPAQNIKASAGVVPATKRIEPSGRIASWLNGEVSLLDVYPTLGRVPVNEYAITADHMKAMYQKAGLVAPQLPQGQTTMGDVIAKFMAFLTALMGMGGGPQTAPSAPPTQQKADAGAATVFDQNGSSNGQPGTGAQAPQLPWNNGSGAWSAGGNQAPIQVHIHTSSGGDSGANQMAGAPQPPTQQQQAPAPMAAPIAAPVVQPAPVPQPPAKKSEEDMTHQKDDSQKAAGEANAIPATTPATAAVKPEPSDEMKALQGSYRALVATQAEAWTMGLMRAGKMLPAERTAAQNLFVALATNDAQKAAGSTPLLDAFKLTYEQREPHQLANDVDATNLKAAGFNSPPSGDNQPMSAAEKDRLLSYTVTGRGLLAERRAKGA